MENRIEKTFATPEGCDLVVENVKGEIKVEGWDRPDTEIVAVQREGEGDVEISQEGRRVVARTKSESGILSWIAKWRVPQVDYAVRVPRRSNVSVKNVTGPIRVADIQGEVRANNVDGSTEVAVVQGPVQAETVNGSLSASGLHGEAKLSTVNGQMRVQGDVLDSLQANTVNGSIEVAARLAPEGHYKLHTVNGSCRLSVPPDFGARVFAHGVNLSVKLQTPSQSIQRKMGSWEGVIGSGDGPLAEVRFETVNGSLKIDNAVVGHETDEFVAKAQEGPTPEPRPEPRPAPRPEPRPMPRPEPAPEPEPFHAKAAPPAAESAPSQLEILQRVERGELSVEEAVKLLQK